MVIWVILLLGSVALLSMSIVMLAVAIEDLRRLRRPIPGRNR